MPITYFVVVVVRRKKLLGRSQQLWLILADPVEGVDRSVHLLWISPEIKATDPLLFADRPPLKILKPNLERTPLLTYQYHAPPLSQWESMTVTYLSLGEWEWDSIWGQIILHLQEEKLKYYRLAEVKSTGKSGFSNL